jgi:hypothetical protein
VPYTTSFYDEGRGILHVGSGVVTAVELIAGTVLDHAAAEGAPRITHGLVDFSAVTDFQVTTADLRHITTENQITVAKAPGALVAVVSPHSFIAGMTRIWAAMADTLGWRCEIFATRSAAEAWLRDTLAAAPRGDKAAT